MKDQVPWAGSNISLIDVKPVLTVPPPLMTMGPPPPRVVPAAKAWSVAMSSPARKEPGNAGAGGTTLGRPSKMWLGPVSVKLVEMLVWQPRQVLMPAVDVGEAPCRYVSVVVLASSLVPTWPAGGADPGMVQVEPRWK